MIPYAICNGYNCMYVEYAYSAIGTLVLIVISCKTVGRHHESFHFWFVNVHVVVLVYLFYICIL